ncbi:hypothetical protein [Chitinophaga sp. S165]|uniref:hypothetical protein n=1 Tax=Chitinophaga sp. S165 TaxID=2135462 RepID=UPI0011B48635|nr:hypothetical protein [Chitinophaga sp. S165]
MEYRPGSRYWDDPAHQLISNFKKDMKYKGSASWPHKERAISQVAAHFTEVIPKLAMDRCTLVPIPPSKTKTHEKYDDRMTRVLSLLNIGKSDVRELIAAVRDMEASHRSGENRPKLEDLIANYRLDEAECKNITKKIVLVDDVVTAGSHFKACKRLIQDRLPNVEVAGLFIARRVVDDPFKELLL